MVRLPVDEERGVYREPLGGRGDKAPLGAYWGIGPQVERVPSHSSSKIGRFNPRPDWRRAVDYPTRKEGRTVFEVVSTAAGGTR
jgi:hypothetical protein